MSINVGANFGKDYFLRTYYGTSRDARTSSKRTSMKNTNLSVADAHALKKAIKDLGDVDYDTTDKDGELYNKFLAFVSTYNNAMDSSNNSDSVEIKHAGKMLKKYASKHADELESLGLSIQENGKLKMASNVGDCFSISKMKKLFSSEDSDFSKEVSKYASRMYSQAYQNSRSASGGIDISV